jgi:Flp pilus assembly protein TadD
MRHLRFALAGVFASVLYATLLPASHGAGDSSATEAEAPVSADEQLYADGKAQAEAGQYDLAIATLSKITNQDDPKVLNYIGYSHRKAGRLEIAIVTYKKAIGLDPGFVQARAYLGEGYIALGQMGLAKAELAEIKTRCGESCPEYQQLAEALVNAGA